MNRDRFVVLLIAAGSSILAATSCNVSSLDLGGLGSLDTSPSTGSTSGSGGGGGGDQDASINLGSSSGSGADPSRRYEALCGTGCRPGGDPSDCAPGGNPGMGGAPPQSQFCRLVLDQDQVAPKCAPVGTFEVGGPCQTGADCAAGLGCAVTDMQGAGACRQYCCGSVEDCAAGTYCAPQPMAEAVAQGNSSLLIPVCIPATNCELLNDSTCPPDRTCSIVREDGTTSCVPIGAGHAHDPCPCAPGYVCSMLTNECKKLCRIDDSAKDCGPNAKCQGASIGYPSGFGVCVGGDF